MVDNSKCLTNSNLKSSKSSKYSEAVNQISLITCEDHIALATGIMEILNNSTNKHKVFFYKRLNKVLTSPQMTGAEIDEIMDSIKYIKRKRFPVSILKGTSSEHNTKKCGNIKQT